MADALDFADAILGAVLDTLDPLVAAATDEAALEEFLIGLGWVPPDEGVSPSALTPLVALASAVRDAATALDGYRAGGSPDPKALASLTADVVAIVAQVVGLGGGAPPAGLPAPFSTPSFWTAMGQELAGHLVAGHLRRSRPLVLLALRLTGILDQQPAAADPNRVSGQQVDVLRWDRLAPLASDPRTLMADVYGWGGALRYDPLFQRLLEGLHAFGVLAFCIGPGQQALDRQYGPGTPVPDTLGKLRVPVTIGEGIPYVELGVDVLPVPAAAGSAVPVGLLIGPYGTVALSATTPVSDSVSLGFSGTVDGSGATGVLLRPGSVQPFVDGPALTGDLGVQLVYAPSSPLTLLGDPQATGVSLQGCTLGLELRTAAAAVSEALARLAFAGLRIGVDFSQGDGFLASVTGGLKKSVQLDGALVWSSVHGLSVEGSPDLERKVPLNLALGPLQVDSVTVAARAQGGVLRVTGGLQASLALGPITASVEGAGAGLTLAPEPGGPFFGLTPGLAFRPPDGLGLAVDAAAVIGGGFLKHDEGKQEYAGVLDLEVVDTLRIDVIGLLTTGPGHFSLAGLVFISDFTPLQLGLGFVLTGVGGMIGVNRTADTDVLRAGLRARTLDHLLFPDDPVGEAPAIIGDLESAFPLAEGRYVFGPMVQLGWGTPPLLTVDLAVLLELPSPVRLILLARMEALLPRADGALVELHVDALGVIDFGQGTAALDATIHDSRLADFALAGDMALRAGWRQQPGFVLAVGGLHPAFPPPPGFPQLRRLTIALASGDNPRLRLETYLAVTSNTVQSGARLDLHATYGSLTLDGLLGYDALFHFSPSFSFVADAYGRLAVSYGGSQVATLDVELDLSGPTPWHGHGSVSVTIGWLLTVSATVDFTAGGAPAVPAVQAVPPVHAKLLAALRDPASWAAQVTGEHALVTLRQVAPPQGAGLAHPLAPLTVHQQVVPMEVQVTRYGNLPLPAPRTFAIDPASVRVNGVAPAVPPERVRDEFAPAQFRDLSDQEKLASPSFELLTSGFRVSLGVAVPAAQSRPVAYELWVVDAGGVRGPQEVPMDGGAYTARAGTAAAARAPLTVSGRARYRAPDRTLTPPGARWVVAGVADLKALPGTAPSTCAQAHDTLAAYLAAHPAERGRWQVVGAHEAAA